MRYDIVNFIFTQTVSESLLTFKRKEVRTFLQHFNLIRFLQLYVIGGEAVVVRPSFVLRSNLQKLII
jgi:hypothetical protein